MRTLVAGCFVLALAGCGALPNSGAKLQEASQELNLNARFGRMEMAVERVSAKEREEFARRHRGWGGTIRIADSEMAGTRLLGDFDAEVTVKIAWYRPNEQDLRVTTLRQKWKAVNGDWFLVGEVKLDGDAGLLGEPPSANDPAPEALPRKKTQFPTIHLGQGGEGPASYDP